MACDRGCYVCDMLGLVFDDLHHRRALEAGATTPRQLHGLLSHAHTLLAAPTAIISFASALRKLFRACAKALPMVSVHVFV